MSDWINQYLQFKETPWSPTVLPEAEEQKFRDWLQNTQIFKANKQDIAAENGIPVDKVDNQRLIEMILKNSDYDYRGAFKDNMKESINKEDNRPHMLSSTSTGQMLKDPSHPTAWKEFFMRQYKVDPDSIGLHDFESAKGWQDQINNNQPQPANVFYKDPMGFTIK
jgi:hypothetical protein